MHNIVSDSNSEAQPAASKVKVGDIRNSCTWHWCSSLSLLDLEPVVGKNPLLWNTGQVFIFPKYPFNDQPEREGERLGGLHTNCLGWDSNQGFWICSWVCYPFYNRGTRKQAKGTSHTYYKLYKQTPCSSYVSNQYLLRTHSIHRNKTLCTFFNALYIPAYLNHSLRLMLRLCM